MLAHYAVCWLMHQAASAHRVGQRTLSFTGHVHLLRRAQPRSGAFPPQRARDCDDAGSMRCCGKPQPCEAPVAEAARTRAWSSAETRRTKATTQASCPARGRTSRLRCWNQNRCHRNKSLPVLFKRTVLRPDPICLWFMMTFVYDPICLCAPICLCSHLFMTTFVHDPICSFVDDPFVDAFVDALVDAINRDLIPFVVIPFVACRFRRAS